MFDPVLKAKKHIDAIKNKKYINEGDEYYEKFIKKLYEKKANENITFFDHGVYTEDTTLKFYNPSNKIYVSGSLIPEAFYVNKDDYDEIKVYSMETIMKNLKHKHIDLLKIDAGGCECEIILQLLNNIIKPKLILVMHNNHVYGDDKVNDFVHKMEDFNYFAHRTAHPHKITYALK